MAQHQTTVVNKYAAPYDVYIGRGSIWGNPFVIGEHGSRDEVIAAYHEYLQQHDELLAKIPELRGKVLGCYCKPKRCHGDILALYADGREDEIEEPQRLF